MKKIDYIKDNERFHWSFEDAQAVSLKGVLANDIGVDYDQILEYTRYWNFESEDGCYACRKYMVAVDDPHNLFGKTRAIAVVVHIHYDDRTIDIYYVEA